MIISPPTAAERQHQPREREEQGNRMDQSKQIITDVNLLAYLAMLAELRYALPQLVYLFHWCRFNGLSRSQNYNNSIIKIHKIQKLFNHKPCNRHEQDDTIEGKESIRLSFIDTYLAWCMLIEVSHLCGSMSMHQ